jgi:choline transport protein
VLTISSNGGPPGVIYEFIAVSIFYWLIAASIAELASSMPSSAGVYHWASITPGPKYGRIGGFFAGWWNTFAWVCGSASVSSIASQIIIGMYGIHHPDYVPERWHVFIGQVVISWMCCCTVLFANRTLPALNSVGVIFILGGVFTTILVCVIMPHTTSSGYATTSFVWLEWSNQTGYTSNGFVFLAGMLNGAFSVGTPDCVAHLAEEIPNPKRNIPLAIGAQMGIGFFTAFFYLTAIFYSISDLETVLSSPYFPLAHIYYQATSSKAGTMGLLLIIFFPIVCCCIGTYITAGRGVWTLAREEAIPFSKTLGKISPRFKNPFNATLLCGCFSTILAAIYVGSTSAFNAVVGSYVVLSTLSYLVAILPFVLTHRFSRVNNPPGPYVNSMRPGYFKMSNSVGYAVNIVSSVYIIVFVVIFCFPYSMPVTAVNMNYACVIIGGISFFAGVYWVVVSDEYVGPKVVLEGHFGESVNTESAVKVA